MTRFLLAIALVLPVFADAADAASRLADKLAAARSLSASFEQTVAGANGVVSQQSTGTMMVARPQLFRWEVKTPFEQLIVADGKEVWVHDPDLAQAVVRRFDRQLADTPALLFGGDAKRIGEHFRVSVIEDKRGSLRFELSPVSEDALFETLRVGFQGNVLRDMTLVDGLGQKTTITFRDVKLNPDIPPARFAFTPPSGTDVIREMD